MLNHITSQSSQPHLGMPDDCDEPDPPTAPGVAATNQLLTGLFERLTDRQAVILRALIAGHTSAEIARLLDCSTANIAWHVTRIRDTYRVLTSPS